MSNWVRNNCVRKRKSTSRGFAKTSVGIRSMWAGLNYCIISKPPQ